MTRFAIHMIACLLLLGLPATVRAQAMADYTSSPPFISNVVPPNILLILDNSGSMNTAAYDDQVFDTSKAYFGLFDPYECYTFGSNKFQPDTSANPTTLGTCGTSYPWSGNLLNYATMRRIDIVKWVMMGGTCSVGGRDAQGGCRQLIGQNSFDSGACCADQTVSVTVAQATGRMPSANIPSSGNVYFHNMGSISNLKGSIYIDNDSNQPSSSSDDSDSYDESVWDIRVDILADASGIIQQVGSKARFGLMEFKGSGDGGKVLSDIGGNVTSMITAIESTTPSTWTPLAESLYEGVRYFAQVAPAYTNSDFSYNVTNRDPFYFQQPTWASTSAYVTCCKSFVIIFTDGEPTQDLNVPSALQDYNHENHGTHCTGATTADTCSGHKTNYASNGTHYLDEVAYYAHINDLRQATLPVLGEAGKDLSGTQNLTIYTFYAFGQAIGREILQSAAKAGGFEDRNGNNRPDLTEEWDRVNNDTGAAGADGIPDTYYESSNAEELQDRLLAAITSILQRSASGTSVSVLATSSTGDGSLFQAYFYPSTFEGLNEIKWTGYTQGLFIDEFGNLREDTDADATLIYSNDYIIQTRYDSSTGEVKIDRYKDTDGDGKADTTTPFESVNLKEVKSLWEAGKQLALKSASSRSLTTWVDTDNDGVVDVGEQIAFTTGNATALSPYLRASTAPYTATNIIDFVRGTQVSGLRDRQMQIPTGSGTYYVWKLGDPIHSTPTVVGSPKERYDVIYGDSTYGTFFQQYKNRRLVAYVGANDGMMHAINAGFYHRGDNSSTSATERGYFTKNATDNSSGAALGEEIWGFIPYQLLPHLKWLTQSDYTHVYYVDLKPKVSDVRIFSDDSSHPGGWGTILIGGFRMGGSCGVCTASKGGPPMTVTADFGSGSNTTRTFYSAYFAIDITNPEDPYDPVAGTGSYGKLLWTFSDSSLGLTTSYPTVLRLKPSCTGENCKIVNTDAKWYMLVGSGPTGYDASSTQVSKIFAVDLSTGVNSQTYTTSDSNSFVGDLISLDVQLDYRADVAYGGNVITNTSPAWIGKLYRLKTNGGNVDPATWGITSGSNRTPTVLLSTFPTDSSLKVGPVTAAPTVTADDVNNIWVFFGTGRYYGTTDKTNTDTQYFFGVKDPAVTGGCNDTSLTACEKKNLLNVSSVTVCTVCSGSTSQVSGAGSGVTTFDELQSKIQGTSSSQAMDGWYTTLSTSGERDVSTPIIVGGTLFFPTFIPSNDICSNAGDGKLYALFYKTGSAYKSSIIGTEVVGSNTNVKRSMSLGTGLASQMAVHVGAQGSGSQGSSSTSGSSGRVSLIGQSSTGAMTKISANPALASWSRYVSWINQRD